MSELTGLYKKMHEFRNKIYAIPKRVSVANSTVDFNFDSYQAIMIDIESIATGLGESDFFYFCEYIEGFIKSVQQENTELKARVERLEAAIMTSYPTEECAWVGDYIKILKTVLNETPQQSLVEIQADAIVVMMGEVMPCCLDEIQEYADNLRNSVKDVGIQ